MAYKDIPDLSHDPDLAVALGNMVIAWAYAEGALCAVLARVTGMNINMALMGFYRIPTFEARTKFIQSLIQEWRPGQYDREAVAKEVGGLSGLASARNGWVHNVWSADKQRVETVIFDFRRDADKGRSGR